MKRRASLIAAFAVAAALTFAAPLAANAYTPSGPDGGSTDVTPGEPTTIGFDGFSPNEDVTFALTGENASGATLATIVRAQIETTSTTKQADAEGSTTVTVTLPSDAFGTYSLTATGETSGAAASTTLDTGVSAPEDDSDGDSLSPTGTDMSSIGLWVGGGALVLGGGAVIAAVALRRQRHDG
ncbi:hypothetical protein N8K70_12865 [Microbacterium betulae]|uniref:Sortase n=1 Tax=Microbacterium betulae TaxID=2981139 RepID=A0AA97FHN8_9MICO|nr:hypothetical protein [Microbacterium sp. AB]WOF22269.1 hypothetical protein N8K70_12865 [Microbacterium sp. AB]